MPEENNIPPIYEIMDKMPTPEELKKMFENKEQNIKGFSLNQVIIGEATEFFEIDKAEEAIPPNSSIGSRKLRATKRAPTGYVTRAQYDALYADHLRLLADLRIVMETISGLMPFISSLGEKFSQWLAYKPDKHMAKYILPKEKKEKENN